MIYNVIPPFYEPRIHFIPKTRVPVFLRQKRLGGYQITRFNTFHNFLQDYITKILFFPLNRKVRQRFNVGCIQLTPARVQKAEKYRKDLGINVVHHNHRVLDQFGQCRAILEVKQYHRDKIINL
jgi:hypothetical protein